MHVVHREVLITPAVPVQPQQGGGGIHEKFSFVMCMCVCVCVCVCVEHKRSKFSLALKVVADHDVAPGTGDLRLMRLHEEPDADNRRD